MNRDTLVRKIAEETGFYKYEVANIIACYEKTISDTLMSGENIFLRGFLDFKIRDYAPRTYINKGTKKEVIVPAKKGVRVRISKKIRDKLDKPSSSI